MAGITSLGSALTATIHKKKGSVMLTEPIEPDDNLGGTLAFQYFPDSITDTKAVAYRNRAIPGGSLPIYQWVDSGERIISFTAFFSSDVNVGTDVVASSLKATVLRAIGEDVRNIDIRSAVVWLRRYMYPRYGQAGS